LATSGIKIGSAYIQITPEMDQAALDKQLAAAEKAIKASYTRQSDISKAYAKLQAQLDAWVTEQFSGELKERLDAATAAAKALQKVSAAEAAAAAEAIEAVQAATEKAEKDRTAKATLYSRQRERIALNARTLEVQYTGESRDAYLDSIEEMQAAGTKMTLTRINEAKQWAALDVMETRNTETAKQRAIALTASVAKTAAAEAAAAYRATFAEVKALILEDRIAQADANSAFLLGEAQKQAAIEATAAKQLTAARAALAQASGSQAASAGAVATVWAKAGAGVDAIGSKATRTGKLLSSNVVVPMAAAATALSVYGVKAADSLVQAQTALLQMGVTAKDTASQINSLKDFGLKTSYSVEDMLTYGTQYTRAILSHDPRAQSSNAKDKAAASSAASGKSVQMVEAIGNLAAYGGITDATQVGRGLKDGPDPSAERHNAVVRPGSSDRGSRQSARLQGHGSHACLDRPDERGEQEEGADHCGPDAVHGQRPVHGLHQELGHDRWRCR